MSNLANLMKAHLMLVKEVKDAVAAAEAAEAKLSEVAQQIWEEQTNNGQRNATRIPIRLTAGGPVQYLTPVRRERNGKPHYYLRGDEEKPQTEVLDLTAE